MKFETFEDCAIKQGRVKHAKRLLKEIERAKKKKRRSEQCWKKSNSLCE